MGFAFLGRKGSIEELCVGQRPSNETGNGTGSLGEKRNWRW